MRQLIPTVECRACPGSLVPHAIGEGSLVQAERIHRSWHSELEAGRQSRDTHV